MRRTVADWVSRRLLERRGDVTAAPGGTQVFRVRGERGTEFAVLARGDAFDLYHGKRTICNYAVPAPVVWRMAWFVIWTWWVRGTWCGLKTRLWRWALKNRG